jgi:hypothetical protein
MGMSCTEAQHDIYDDCSEFEEEPADCDESMGDGCCQCVP